MSGKARIRGQRESYLCRERFQGSRLYGVNRKLVVGVNGRKATRNFKVGASEWEFLPPSTS